MPRPAAVQPGAVQRLRAMVASLKEGHGFTRRLAGALPHLAALLANPAAGVVQDTVVVLTLCKCVWRIQGFHKQTQLGPLLPCLAALAWLCCACILCIHKNCVCIQCVLQTPKAISCVLCRSYEVPGAAKALRGMWPLVFSKHEPVRQAVLESWHILHLQGRSSKQQVQTRCTRLHNNCRTAVFLAHHTSTQTHILRVLATTHTHT